MAKEYIEKEAAKSIIEERQKQLCPVGMYSRHAVYGTDREKFDAWDEILNEIDYLPAANVRENVKSKWEDVEITMITEDNAPSEIVSMFCPNCKRYHNEVYHYGNPIENANFCPRCGADMTGGNDG